MGNPAELIPNMTFFIQLGLFFICFALLHYLVFTPYLNLLELRRSKTSGLKEKSIHDREKAEKLRVEYDTRMKAERRKNSAILDEERKKVSDEERAIISEARNKVAAELKRNRDELDTEVEKVRKELAPLANEYSSQIASKLLGRKVSVSAASAGVGSGASSSKRLKTETTIVG